MKWKVEYFENTLKKSKEITADLVNFETHFVKFISGKTLDAEIVFAVPTERVISVEKA